MERIPFGLHVGRGELVDVTEVPRGRNCGCICPSCKARLVAKHGDVYTWHFAHDTDTDQNRPSSTCDYSAWVSLRQMALQQLAKIHTLSFAVPDFRLRSGYGPVVASPGDVVIEKCSTLVATPYGTADLEGFVGSQRVLLFLFHPERSRPQPRLAAATDSWVLGMDLGPVLKMMLTEASATRTCAQILGDQLNRLDGLRWIDHPDLNAVLANESARAEQRLQEVREQQRAHQTGYSGRSSSPARQSRYTSEYPLAAASDNSMPRWLHCSLCGHDWEGTVKSCPKGCGSICVSSSPSWRR